MSLARLVNSMISLLAGLPVISFLTAAGLADEVEPQPDVTSEPESTTPSHQTREIGDPNQVFLDDRCSIESRTQAMEFLRNGGFEAHMEQRLGILANPKLPDEMRSFIADRRITVTDANQAKVDRIATSILRANGDGGRLLRTCILSWLSIAQSPFWDQGAPRVEDALMRELLDDRDAGIRKLALQVSMKPGRKSIEQLEQRPTEALKQVLAGDKLGRLTLKEAIQGLLYLTPDEFDPDLLLPFLHHESDEVRILVAQAIGSLDRQYLIFQRLFPVLTNGPGTTVQVKIAVMDSITRLLQQSIHRRILHSYPAHLVGIVKDEEAPPALCEAAIRNLESMLKFLPPETLKHQVVDPLYALWRSGFKEDATGLKPDAWDHQLLPVWAVNIQTLGSPLIRKYQHIAEQEEQRKALASARRLEHLKRLLHDPHHDLHKRIKLLRSVDNLNISDFPGEPYPKEAEKVLLRTANDLKLRQAAYKQLRAHLHRQTQERRNLQARQRQNAERAAGVLRQVSLDELDDKRMASLRNFILQHYPELEDTLFPEGGTE